MNSSIAVIGANFGDEGKGQLTDALVRRVQQRSNRQVMVSRFNGGAQAGHTVVTKDARHVFGHIGSGTFAGADTYLGSKFIVNLLALEGELKKCPVDRPKICFGARNRMTSIFDMSVNAIAEIMRTERHGSCGLGINETVTREEAGFVFNPKVLFRSDEDSIAQRLRVLRHVWVPIRLESLGLPNIKTLTAMAKDNQILSGPMSVMIENQFDFAGHARQLIEIGQSSLTAKVPISREVIFEGAQGLALDENLGTFPHVTRSITGLPFAIITAAELAKTELTPLYITRPYLTRHGAGNLEHEGEEFCSERPSDVTNITNEWQGTLRFAPLNLPMMKRLIKRDLMRAVDVASMYGVKLNSPLLAITCLDQIKGEITIVDLDGSKKRLQINDLPEYVCARLGIKLGALSHGPGAENVEFSKLTYNEL